MHTRARAQTREQAKATCLFVRGQDHCRSFARSLDSVTFRRGSSMSDFFCREIRTLATFPYRKAFAPKKACPRPFIVNFPSVFHLQRIFIRNVQTAEQEPVWTNQLITISIVALNFVRLKLYERIAIVCIGVVFCPFNDCNLYVFLFSLLATTELPFLVQSLIDVILNL